VAIDRVPGTSEVTVHCHEGESAFTSATPAWRALLLVLPRTTVFSRPEWAATWAAVYGPGHKPMIVEVRDGGRAIGLAPFQLTRYPLVRARRLEFIGGSAPTPSQWLINPGHLGQSFYNDILFAPGHEEVVLKTLGTWWRDRGDEWDEIALTCVPAASALVSGFAGALEWPSRSMVQTKFFVDTSAGWEEYLTRLSKRQRRHLRYEPHALKRAAGAALQLEEVRGGEVATAIEDYLDLVRQRWSAVGRRAMTSGDVDLYRRLARQPACGMVVYRLTAGRRVLAIQVGFDDGHRYIPFAFAFDPTLERTSPAQVLMHFVIQRCCEDGHEEVDLAALADVGRWAGQPRDRVHLRARSARPMARLRALGLASAGAGLVAGQRSRAGRWARSKVSKRLAT
jgi:CelD/BcsL family acetyltransferase involved in cellulose biosynthesis